MKYLLAFIVCFMACSEIALDSEIKAGKELFETQSLYKSLDELGLTELNEGAPGTTRATCINCHPAGHSDNKNWNVGLGRKWKTQTLWNVEHTAPYLWNDSIPVTKLEDLVSFLLNKFLIDPSNLETKTNQLTAYIKTFPSPLSPFRNTDGSLTENQLQGKSVFEGRGNCTACHNGKWFTDNKAWKLNDTLGIFTPSLSGMWDTAPYWHNGKFKTIRDLLDGHKWIVGETKFKVDPAFTEMEKERLEAYLNAL